MASRRLKRADTELTFATIDSEKGSKEKVTVRIPPGVSVSVSVSPSLTGTVQIVRATTKDIALEHVER